MGDSLTSTSKVLRSLIVGASLLSTEACISPPPSSSVPSVAEIYQEAERTLRRPGMLYHATITVEVEGGLTPQDATIEQWLNADQDAAREEVQLENSGSRTTLETREGRYVREADGRVTTTPVTRCHQAGVATSALLGCPGPTELATTDVQPGQYQGRKAVVLATQGTWYGADEAFSFAKRLYLDPDTFLPLALESSGEVDFGRVRPTRERRVWGHEMIPLDRVPGDFFDPAAVGYRATNVEESLDQLLPPNLTIYWLGAQFVASSDLPPLQLAQVEPSRPGGRPGYQLRLHYTEAANHFGPPAVTLEQWPRLAWNAFLTTATGMNAWDDPCWGREDRSLANGQATLLVGFTNGAARDPARHIGRSDACPGGPPDWYLAHAYLGQTVVLVMAPGVSGVVGTTRSPYDSHVGMEAILRALRPRSTSKSATR